MTDTHGSITAAGQEFWGRWTGIWVAASLPDGEGNWADTTEDLLQWIFFISRSRSQTSASPWPRPELPTSSWHLQMLAVAAAENLLTDRQIKPYLWWKAPLSAGFMSTWAIKVSFIFCHDEPWSDSCLDIKSKECDIKTDQLRYVMLKWHDWQKMSSFRCPTLWYFYEIKGGRLLWDRGVETW